MQNLEYAQDDAAAQDESAERVASAGGCQDSVGIHGGPQASN